MPSLDLKLLMLSGSAESIPLTSTYFQMLTFYHQRLQIVLWIRITKSSFSPRILSPNTTGSNSATIQLSSVNTTSQPSTSSIIITPHSQGQATSSSTSFISPKNLRLSRMFCSRPTAKKGGKTENYGRYWYAKVIKNRRKL